MTDETNNLNSGQYSTFEIQPWKVLERENVFEKFGRGMERVLFQLPDGSRENYYVKSERSTVAIFAVTGKKEEVILIEQFRPGPQKIIRELPGGYINAQETPLQAAKRELLEETGYKGSLKHLFSYYDCAYSTRIRHCFIATNCFKKLPGASEQTKIEGQIILVPIASIRLNIFQTPMTDVACALAALERLSRH